MKDLSQYINGLNSELQIINNYDCNSVYKAFEKFVINKDILYMAVDAGLFNYDYVKYKTMFEGGIFEDGISAILELYRSALVQNEMECKKLLLDSYSAISKGFASFGQSVWIDEIEVHSDRLDLFTKRAFQFIGDGIENSLKPHVEFLDGLFSISLSKPIKKKKLGVIIDNLIAHNEIFKALYKTLFLDITVSQWRNISNHGSFCCTSDEKIEISYGGKTTKIQYIDRSQLQIILVTLDTLLYMHKTAYTLIHVDYDGDLMPLQKYEGTLKDDCISQIVETAFACELKVLDIDTSEWNITAVMRKGDISRENLEKYSSLIAAILSGSKFKSLIYNQNKVQYQIIYEDRQAKIFEYIV